MKFDLFDKAHQLGILGFVDGGRVWADFHRLSELDGDGPGLKVGFGGGLRLGAGNRSCSEPMSRRHPTRAVYRATWARGTFFN